ncbi:lipase family protein [Sphingomonas sp. LB-2]|uniref:lipase family protein n=1 Tax=Sphingomonas caeni TaxID=2984949 RepID=UPI00222E176E|nr:lipase family protein [Sphingomonas caeni]MCW3847941.1 lipase family protein [Sphingomonas caeni]
MKRRLLYASSQAYQPKMEMHGRSVGWLEPPMVVRREMAHRPIDLALVGRVPEGVVVAFRGSLPPFFGAYEDDGWTVLLDWLNDANSLCVQEPGFAGGVHLGFAESMRRLWVDGEGELGVRHAVQAMLDQTLLDRKSRRHLFVTGHSKGGALANLFAWRAARVGAWMDMPVSVATIAAARAGNAEFARAYAAERIACLRYELTSDLVPHLPPGRDTPDWVRGVARTLAPKLAAMDYHAVGLRVAPVAHAHAKGHPHQRWAGSRRRILPSLLGRRGLGLEALLPSVLKAHAICPDSGYDRLICQGEGCDHGG